LRWRIHFVTEHNLIGSNNPLYFVVGENNGTEHVHITYTSLSQTHTFAKFNFIIVFLKLKLIMDFFFERINYG